MHSTSEFVCSRRVDRYIISMRNAVAGIVSEHRFGDPSFFAALVFVDIVVLASVLLLEPVYALVCVASLGVSFSLLLSRRGFLYFLVIVFGLWGLTPYGSSSLRLLKYGVGFGMFLLFFARHYFAHQTLSVPDQRVLRPFVIFLAYVTVTIVFASDFSLALGYVARLGLYLIAFVFIYNLIDSASDLVSVSRVAVVVGAGVFLFGLYESFVLHVYRTASTLGNPNALGFYSLVTVSIVLMLYQTAESRLSKFALASVSILGFLTIYASLGRSSILTTALFVAAFLWVNRYRKLFWGLAALVATGVFMFLVNASLQLTLSDMLRLGSRFTGRDILWAGAIGMIKENFFFGVGPRCVATVFSHFVHLTDPRVPFLISTPLIGGKIHNGYLQVFAEMGIFGFLTFLYVNVAFYRYLLSSYKKVRDKITKYAVQWLLLIIPALAVRALVESTVIYGPVTDKLLLIVFFAAVVKLIDVDRRHRSITSTELLPDITD